MLLVLGLAIDETGWGGPSAPGGETSWVPLVALGSGGLGLLLGWSRLGAGKAHLAASAAGAAAVLIAVAGVTSDAPALEDRIRAVNESMVVFFRDVFVLEHDSTTEFAWLLLLVGAITWTTGYFAAFNLFRRSRALPAVVATGAVLLVTMSASLRVQYGYLVAFSALALLLFVRINYTRQQHAWERRLIADGSRVGAPFLRGGALLVAVAVAGAVGLASVASAQPLARSWDAMDDLLIDVASVLDRWTGGIRTGATINGLFPDTQPISGLWPMQNTPLFAASSSDERGYYWRGATYDGFDGHTWRQLGSQALSVEANEDVLADTDDELADPVTGRLEVELRVTTLGYQGGTLLAPETPLSVDRAAQVRTAGDRGPMAAIDFQEQVSRGDGYTVVSLVRDPEDDILFTRQSLSSAGTNYPSFIVPRYTQIAEGSSGERVRTEATRIRSELPASQRDPFHVADAIEDFFHGPGFRYATDVRAVCRSGESVAECLLRARVGYCQHYASAMIMMLRELDIPARYVQGYLPGKRLEDGTWEVDASAAHAWVEVYFPGAGWVQFDPTPGNLEGQEATDLPEGEAFEPPVAESPEPTLGTFEPEPSAVIDEAVLPPDDPADPGAEGTGGLPDWALAAGVATALTLVVIVVLFVRWRRGGGLTAESAWSGIARFAARFGYRLQPTQTPYEYTSSLARVVPGVRSELEVVARAKVEATYARRTPGGEGLATLRRAYRRARLGLIRLFFRPPV
jgi:hypothetical protein